MKIDIRKSNITELCVSFFAGIQERLLFEKLMKIEEYLTCSHTVRCLKAAGIENMDQLAAMDTTSLLQIRGIGEKIAAYLSEEIERFNREQTQIC